ncbi:Eco47II family restriction endonuclease [Armatimonas sp.]|uniref:Eco47II family restriction endonuclease n=1 Tax=Armatimonas sp. TaxID=1872638 RepID=UPI00374FF99E
MPYLDFISDETFKRAVRKVIDVQNKANIKGENEIFANVVDPYSAIFESCFAKISYPEWIKLERSRQSQKSAQNSIGNFHEDILIGADGWEKITKDQPYLNEYENTMLDIRNQKIKIVAEIKNKHNTIKGSSNADMYDTLNAWISNQDEGFTAYLVHIIPDKGKPYDIPYTPAKGGLKRPTNNSIRVIDGRSFYAKVFSLPNALDLIFEKLPEVINDVILETNSDKITKNNNPIVVREVINSDEKFGLSFSDLFRRAYPWDVDPR